MARLPAAGWEEENEVLAPKQFCTPVVCDVFSCCKKGEAKVYLSIGFDSKRTCISGQPGETMPDLI